MIGLERTVRVCLDEGTADGGVNGFGGTPAMNGFGRSYELRVRCAGEPSRETGYLLNIKEIDAAVRERAVPLLREACGRTGADPRPVALALVGSLAPGLRGLLRGLRLSLTPTYSLEATVDDPKRVTIRQRFDFAASHRLHVPALSDDENRELFGKCNSPNGHGHNYQIEPAVRVDAGDPGFSLEALERLTDEAVVQRFDHKHLNLDTAEFANGGGLNPSVENIAMVCFGLLDDAIGARFGDAAELRAVTVWETDRTSATYPAS